MKIAILGTRGEIEPTAPYHSRQSGILVDDRILFDLGEKEFLEHKPDYIFFTHLHPDHAFFVRDSDAGKIPGITAFAPERYPEAPLDIKVAPRTKKIGSYTITAVPTHHSKRVKSVAYVIERNKQKLVYTGDMIWINKEYHHYLEDATLIISEGSFIKKGGMIRRDDEGTIYGHTGIPDIIRLFKDFTDSMLIVHFGSWFYKDIKKARARLRELGRDYGVTVRAGYDGMRLDLGNIKALAKKK
jgi:ribonuclease BN (tRNA processing enzyme)